MSEQTKTDDASKQQPMRESLQTLLETFNVANDERLQQANDCHAEATRWKAEGDMYGWNFYEGRASGVTSASIIFDRIRRQIETMLSELS